MSNQESNTNETNADESVLPAPACSEGFVVTFENVGRAKDGWCAMLPDIEYDSLIGSVRKNGSLHSRGLEFMTDDEQQTGVIFAGMRPVGTFFWS